MLRQNKQNLSMVKNTLVDVGCSGEPFATEVKEILNTTVQVAKRSELRKFKELYQRDGSQSVHYLGQRNAEDSAEEL